MKAIVLRETGGCDKLEYTESYPVPIPGPGEVLIKNDIAGINFADIYFRTGLYPSATGYPLVLGLEAIGTVVGIQHPNSFGFHTGDRVLYSNVPGAYAEYTAVPGAKVVKARSDIASDDAVGGYTIGLTALSLIEQGYSATQGDTVLVHAASGGVGLTLCQLLSDRGVTVLGTASDESKFAIATTNGTSHMLNYTSSAGPDWTEQVMQLTGGRGVDAVFDSVGKDTWEGSFAVTKLRGKVIFIGAASGKVPPIDLSSYSRPRNISVLYSALVNSISTREDLELYASRVQEMIVQGTMKVNKYKTYRLRDAAQAMEDLESRKTTGKLLMKI
ncbi:hypothetical protein AYO22_02349 [Fonsecaea multimorphosa]|nr:hypothetical protein AYO22_02349 [Fonsecaea multimorphosa]